MDEGQDLSQKRFLTRSLLPHLVALRKTFTSDRSIELSQNYWKDTKNIENRLFAYCAFYFPMNALRAASVLDELFRLDFHWDALLGSDNPKELRITELGAGPGSFAFGLLRSFAHRGWPTDIPIRFTAQERDRRSLDFFRSWIQNDQNPFAFTPPSPPLQIEPKHIRIDRTEGEPSKKKTRSPRTTHGTRSHILVSSFFMNELSDQPEDLARRLIEWSNTELEEDGMILLIEPALKDESRRFLAAREWLLQNPEKHQLQFLLPCMGQQKCGAFAKEKDWCHEVVTWWRPKYFMMLDQLMHSDHRHLPFTYFVIIKSKKPLSVFLPMFELKAPLARLVSPSRMEGRRSEFYICDHDGKHRVRSELTDLDRGHILVGAKRSGDSQIPLLQNIQKILNVEVPED